MKQYLWIVFTLLAILTYPLFAYGIVPRLPQHFQDYGGQIGALITLAFFLLAGIFLYENDPKSPEKNVDEDK